MVMVRLSEKCRCPKVPVSGAYRRWIILGHALQGIIVNETESHVSRQRESLLHKYLTSQWAPGHRVGYLV